MFSIFFAIIFYCALARIELLIDVLPDLEKNSNEFFKHKLVWGAIFMNKIIHCLVAFSGLYCNWAYTPSVDKDANPVVVKITQIIYMVQELIYFFTYSFQIKILYDYSACKLSKIRVEDIILKEEVNLIVFL